MFAFSPPLKETCLEASDSQKRSHQCTTQPTKKLGQRFVYPANYLKDISREMSARWFCFSHLPTLQLLEHVPGQGVIIRRSCRPPSMSKELYMGKTRSEKRHSDVYQVKTV
ncbi:Hypothetical predicted protein [Marmota monax]|uniref:Uncharacterized protein n=1 Tax=Marmota monax TaxID=9995 RepID=A0A5E4BDR9_MARMO|nr:hypothetical protein GHT09_012399 [Marmota monax]VTJ67837.1 Hypothetical predicted protein [Marmota monax]